jgi:hypothetical protein
MAGGPGFEPRLTESESAVLPLNYPPKQDEVHVAHSVSVFKAKTGSGTCSKVAKRRRAVTARATPFVRRQSMVSPAKSSMLPACSVEKGRRRRKRRRRPMIYRRPYAILRMRPKIPPC